MATGMLCLLVVFYLSVAFESPAAAVGVTTTTVGVIVDETTRVGREQRVAMKVAEKDFNDHSHHVKLSLLFANSSYIYPLQAASAATELCEEKKVEAIIGMETWQEAAMVAEATKQYKIPVISLPPSPSSLPFASQRWPFMVQISPYHAHQIKCISAMVSYFGWRRVVAVYEDDGHGAISMLLTLLSRSLQENGTIIEHNLALPPLMEDEGDYGEIVVKEMVKMFGVQSRVFVVLQCSLPVAFHLFKEAKKIGVLGRESVWIVTESIAGLLESVNSTFTSNMQGVLGIKSYYDDSRLDFLDFRFKFRMEFRSRYPNEEESKPSVYALRAYDGMKAIGNGLKKPGGGKLFERIIGSKFLGLSGMISFSKGGELATFPKLRLLNVVGRMYVELDFWCRDVGFCGVDEKQDSVGECQVLKDVVWPGRLDQIPKGWSMPTDAVPLRIAVPGRTSFEMFVRVENSTGNPNTSTYSGYCIDVFLEVVKILELSYAFPYEFHAFNGTYDELVDSVFNKTFDAAVGDVTILAERWKKVDFTMPHVKSGLSMVVPFKSKESQKAWLFIKPFTPEMWLITGATLVHTMFVVWFLERQINPEFGGSWKDQLSASLWFTFSSIFFLHREKIRSNYTRIVAVVWLVVVFILTQSYTASLTSMLTLPILEPKVTDLDWLISNKQPIGCDGDSFVRDYLINVLKISPDNLVNVASQYYYPENFDNKTITAAFLEVPYERVFLNQYCKDYTSAPKIYEMGGFGFVFQKGSPLTEEVSKAILQLSENGVLKSLDDKWFSPSLECAKADNDTEQLSIQGFKVLFIVSGVISTVCFVVYVVNICRSYNRSGDEGSSDVWNGLARVARFYHMGGAEVPGRLILENEGIEEWVAVSPPLWDSTPTPSDAEERQLVLPPPAEIELHRSSG